MNIPDPVWQVICDYLKKYRGIDAPIGLKEWAEQNCTVTLFDGGCFLSNGGEFDLFVVPEKRGRWRIRSTVQPFIDDLVSRHGSAKIGVYDDNFASLRLAHHFGFREVSRDGNMIRLEKHHG